MTLPQLDTILLYPNITLCDITTAKRNITPFHTTVQNCANTTSHVIKLHRNYTRQNAVSQYHHMTLIHKAVPIRHLAIHDPTLPAHHLAIPLRMIIISGDIPPTSLIVIMIWIFNGMTHMELRIKHIHCNSMFIEMLRFHFHNLGVSGL